MVERRFKYVWFSARHLTLLVTGTMFKTMIEGFPEGASHVFTEYVIQADAFRIYFHHPDWEIVPDGEMAPAFGRIVFQFVSPDPDRDPEGKVAC